MSYPASRYPHFSYSRTPAVEHSSRRFMCVKTTNKQSLQASRIFVVLAWEKFNPYFLHLLYSFQAYSLKRLYAYVYRALLSSLQVSTRETEMNIKIPGIVMSSLLLFQTLPLCLCFFVSPVKQDERNLVVSSLGRFPGLGALYDHVTDTFSQQTNMSKLQQQATTISP